MFREQIDFIPDQQRALRVLRDIANRLQACVDILEGEGFFDEADEIAVYAEVFRVGHLEPREGMIELDLRQRRN